MVNADDVYLSENDENDSGDEEDAFTTADAFASKQSEQDALLDELLTRVTASPAPRPSLLTGSDTLQQAVDTAVWSSGTFGIWRVKTRVRPASLFQHPIDISPAKPTTSFAGLPICIATPRASA